MYNADEFSIRVNFEFLRAHFGLLEFNLVADITGGKEAEGV